MSTKQIQALQKLINMAKTTGHLIFWTPEGELNGDNEVMFLFQGNNLKLKGGRVLNIKNLKSNCFSAITVSPIVILDMI